MDFQQLRAALSEIKPVAQSAVILIEDMLDGADGPTKRLAGIKLLRELVNEGSRLASVPAIVLAFISSDAVLGFVVDAAVALANRLGLFAVPAPDAQQGGAAQAA